MRGAPRGRRRVVVALATFACCFAGPPARAHVVYGTTTLRLLTLESDLVARMKIVDPDAELLLEDPLVREAVVVAEVLEPLKGAFAEEQLRFVQHGHGVPKYEKGEEVALFAQHIERSRELGRSPIAAHIHWVSAQEAGVKFALDASTRDGFVAAVRAYAELEMLPPEEQPGGLRRITVELLASPQERLARSALRDAVLAADAPVLVAEDLPALESVLASPDTPTGVRIGLLAELERRALVQGPPRWAELLRTTTGPDRFAVVRAAGAHPSAPVAKELAALLASDDPLLVAAAAVSLGAPGDESAVAPLAKLLDSDEQRVRMAAIRGLAQVGSSGAREVLAKAAAEHPEAATRRRAAAEVKLLERRTATSADP